MFTENLMLIETASQVARVLDRPSAAPAGDVRHTVHHLRRRRDPIVLSGLSKSFGDVPVLHDIDLAIEAGQFVAIIGKSGCGKSTLLRLLMGLEAPTSGDVRGVMDEKGGNSSPPRFMFQEPRLLPWARVVDNVAVGVEAGISRDEKRRRALAALAEVGLEGRCDEWPSVLSGGQKQRVALARALVGHPHLLAFDEPLGALDALTRLSMQGLVERIWRDQGFTAILVTHDVGEAVALADRILLIEDGGITLDMAVDLPRPRRRATPAFAALEKTVLDALFATAGEIA